MFEEPAPELDQRAASAIRTPNRWETLEQAFRAHGFPTENLRLVQRIVDHLGVSHYEDIATLSYIKGIRNGGGKTLHIHFGYTGGLSSEAEILDSVGDVDRGSWFDGREWWVSHPVNKLRDGNGMASRSGARAVRFCPTCSMQLPASGICDACAT
ncbi:hypothetical protein ET445_12865 [Agromyces protaetiae]|uniref:Uncharacterized protein n=1 Tax=Agromyces protaetiae TaxID=2509455 RepID=A0A4P6FU65_9MICO|nr:hypothetical protein [Agromyces protaetiae]QAY74098.1 hypothetical protein ET445_12865 [Agromyces protaetiae]